VYHNTEPALPILSHETLQVASYFESPTTRRLSLSPPRHRNEQMSHSLEHTITTLLAETNLSQTTSQPVVPSNDTRDAQSFPPPKRSEVLRHVFPRPSRSRTPYIRKAAPRVIKPDRSNAALASRLHSRPRVALHRYFTSLFGGAQDRDVTRASPEARSRASSFGSKPGSSTYGSAPSLDVVSPATFMFSGPSLRSIGSYSNSTSRLPSLAETGSDVQLLRHAHTDSFSMLDDASVIEDGILEPGVDQGIIRTVSDVLLGISTPSEEEESPLLVELGQNRLRGASGLPVTSYFRLTGRATDPSKTTFVTLLSPYLEISAWKASRLTNWAWYRALSAATPRRFPASYYLPVEIVQHVYDYLGPKDFNHARHTCRNWMRASLDKRLLVAMLSRGGWLSSAENHVNATRSAASHLSATVLQSEEWALSRHLSRQCALASGWTGNGLDNRSALVLNTEIDFSELANGYASGLLFATSLCSRFLCVARETLIYIYDLENGHTVPITSVVCPRRVLEMSMDVSSGRHAIAALLEGRMGMVCELQYGRKPVDKSPIDTHNKDNDYHARTITRASVQTSHANDFEEIIGHEERTLPEQHRSIPYVQERDATTFNAIGIRSNDQDVNLRDADDPQTFDQQCINRAWNLDIRGPSQKPVSQAVCVADLCARSITIETGTSTLYRHLCSEDDPPRSVSICPQRRCVAFGCSAGIELHWIDALTGQSLSRWFPLTAPSKSMYSSCQHVAHIEQVTICTSSHHDPGSNQPRSCVSSLAQLIPKIDLPSAGSFSDGQ
jgi:hypothetical protein